MTDFMAGASNDFLPHTHSSVTLTAKDGTTIGYQQYGQGPSVVIVHGTMSSAHNHMQLAEALADQFTVYVMDRRGRGLSGPYSPNYSIQHEVDDLAAVLEKTGTQQIFGVSSGGIICLEAALVLPTIQKVAIFEPPFFVDDPRAATQVLARFEDEMAQGKVAAALVTAMKGAEMGPHGMPRWVLTGMTKLMMAYEARKGSSGYVPMRELAPTLHYDFELVVAMNEKLATFKNVQNDVLLLGGSKSPAYLKTALDALENTLPHVTRTELGGLDHAASWNADRGGKPQPVAESLRKFFA